ncbi:SusE domain-containing protein [Pedobacter lithocola]|uniref:SusE domain-containing protein n=1 Tax=Pedobacter lithocola TaxID=1908239 RepID=A0ABV8PGX3_9SPHI
MKSLILKSMALSLIAVSLWSCKKDETKAIATSGTGGALQTSATSVVLDKSKLTTNVITFTLNDASFGYQAAVSNVLQLAVKGTNFATPKEAILDAKAVTKAYNGLDFNNLLLSLGIPTTSNTDIEIRVKASISNNTAPVYSNVVTVSAKPFPLTAWIYVPGNYQGWNPATADSLISATGNGVYTGVIAFDGDKFKITPAKKWDIAYGDAGGGKISTSGADINSVTKGAKQLTVDLNANTFTLTPLVWSIIGNAVPGSNWSVDTDMKFINDGNNTWTITTPLTAGELKFRLNHDWGTSIGDGANNVVIASAGTYKLTLKLNADGKTGSFTAVKQ